MAGRGEGRGRGEAAPARGGRGEQRRVGFRGTDANKFTRICQRWEAGHCRFGDRCNFAHGDEQLRQLPPRSGGGGRGRGRGEGGYESGGRGSGGRGQGGYGAPAAGAAGSSIANGRTGEVAVRRDDAAWRAAGCPVPGPQGWTQYRTADGEAYYHNSGTEETVWDAPECWNNPPKVT